MPPTERLMDAFTAALKDTEHDEDRANVCLWVASRGFLGLAHERGFVEAAKIAYRFADQLAGADA